MDTFASIKGHERLIGAFQTAMRHNHVSHAYILDGTKGIGKMMLARAFAKALQCAAGTDTPCNECISCRQFDSGNNPDVFYPAPTKTVALGVDDVREQLVRAVDTKPYQHLYKIFILDTAENMSPAAQNALLKTLEEPPAYAIFLLLTENSAALLPTVLSRCVLYKLRPLPMQTVESHLISACGIPAEQARLAAIYAQGSIGRAIGIATSESFAALRNETVALLENIERNSLAKTLQAAKEFEARKDDIQELLDIAYLWYRDIAAILAEDGTAHVLQQDLTDRLRAAADNTHSHAAHARLEAVWRTKRNLRRNGNFRMAVDVLLLDLWEAK